MTTYTIKRLTMDQIEAVFRSDRFWALTDDQLAALHERLEELRQPAAVSSPQKAWRWHWRSWQGATVAGVLMVAFWPAVQVLIAAVTITFFVAWVLFAYAAQAAALWKLLRSNR
jgi:hypothetical protein